MKNAVQQPCVYALLHGYVGARVSWILASPSLSKFMNDMWLAINLAANNKHQNIGAIS